MPADLICHLLPTVPALERVRRWLSLSTHQQPFTDRSGFFRDKPATQLLLCVCWSVQEDAEAPVEERDVQAPANHVADPGNEVDMVPVTPSGQDQLASFRVQDLDQEDTSSPERTTANDPATGQSSPAQRASEKHSRTKYTVGELMLLRYAWHYVITCKKESLFLLAHLR